MRKLKQTEKALIAALRKNSNRNILKIANENNIPKSTLFDALWNLEDEKIIKHNSLVDFEKIGFPFKVFIFIKTIISQKSKLKFHLKDKKNINNLHMIDKNYDYFFEGIFKSLKDLELFLLDLESNFTIVGKEIYHVIETVSQENFLTSIEHFEDEKYNLK